MGIISDAKGQLTLQSVVRSELILSSHACYNYLQVWKGSDKKTTEKRWQHRFSIITISVAIATSRRILPNFKLIQALMYVIVTCKYEMDPIKNSREKVATPFFIIISSWRFFFQTLKGSYLRSRWSDLAEFRTPPSSHACHQSEFSFGILFKGTQVPTDTYSRGHFG